MSGRYYGGFFPEPTRERKSSMWDNRKGWESKFDPKFTKGTSARNMRSTPPKLSSLPVWKSVRPRNPDASEDSVDFHNEMRAWIAKFTPKCRELYVEEDGLSFRVFLFKKSKDAMLFKLTWG